MKKVKLCLSVLTEADVAELLRLELLEMMEFRKRYQLPIEYKISIKEID